MATIYLSNWGLAGAIGTASALASGLSNLVKGKWVKGAVQTAVGAGILVSVGLTLKETATMTGFLGGAIALHSQGFNKLAKAVKDRDVREAAKAVGYFGAGTAVALIPGINLNGTVALAAVGAFSSLSSHLWSKAYEKVSNSPTIAQALRKGANYLTSAYNRRVGPGQQLALEEVLYQQV